MWSVAEFSKHNAWVVDYNRVRNNCYHHHNPQEALDTLPKPVERHLSPRVILSGLLCQISVRRQIPTNLPDAFVKSWKSRTDLEFSIWTANQVEKNRITQPFSGPNYDLPPIKLLPHLPSSPSYSAFLSTVNFILCGQVAIVTGALVTVTMSAQVCQWHVYAQKPFFIIPVILNAGAAAFRAGISEKGE